jgi:hypothetical protein
MKVHHLIAKLQNIDPDLTVSLCLLGWVATPYGAGDAGEMIFREPRREKALDALCKLHPDDIVASAATAVITLSQVVRYELTDQLRLRTDLRPANQHVTRDPERDDVEALLGPIKTLVFPPAPPEE